MKKIKESFPGQPEDKDISTGVSVPFKQANKEHDENVKNAEDAMTANQEAVDLVYGDNTKKKDGKFKNNELKKMHLSENLFSDNFNEDYNGDYTDEEIIDDIIDELDAVVTDWLHEIEYEKPINKELFMKAINDFVNEHSGFYGEMSTLDDYFESYNVNESCETNDIEEDMDLDEAADTVFDKIAKKLAVSEDLKKNE